jgi:hypothetical protein
MTEDTRPFWQRPLPPIRYPASVTDGRPPIDTDPLAEPETVKADGAAPANDDLVTQGDQSSPQARPVENSTPVAFPVSDAAVAEASGDALPPPLSVLEAQRRLVEVQLRCARATDRQRKARGNVALALAAFQKATMQTQTQEQLIRQHIESENQLRADRVAGKIPQRGGQRRLGSAIDAFAYYTRATGRSAGGGAAFRRGATTKRTPSDLKAFPGSGLPQIKE